ncbi:hypothetical protein ACIBSW_13245 [Actinoplanes sp. NPDC049668]|uniref:hypothetical protein n=1 Tax=unclassified Actinoplanes TaxID=2626549 RepID=UPI0033A76A9F
MLIAESITEVNGLAVFGTPRTHQRRSVPLPRFLIEPMTAHLDDLVSTPPGGEVLRNNNSGAKCSTGPLSRSGTVAHGHLKRDETICAALGWRRRVLPMLPVTRELLDRFAGVPAPVSLGWESMAVDVVMRHGSLPDARALLPAFLDSPATRAELVPVLAAHGDATIAERLAAECAVAGRLRDGVPFEVLHALGYLGHEPAGRLLWQYAEQPDPAGVLPASGVPEACLGLLHLRCDDLRTEIGQALERHVGAGLFPEFLPILATKTGDPAWLGRLVEWGEGAASTDCNGGLILGVALHGPAALPEFLRLLWNPSWEANGGGTGSNRWAYAGARVLGLDMARLYGDLTAHLNSDADARVKRHCVQTFTALLDLWVSRPWLGLAMAPDPPETFHALLDLLFEWSTPHYDDSLIGLAGRVLDHDDSTITTLYELERELRLRATYELERQQR